MIPDTEPQDWMMLPNHSNGDTSSTQGQYRSKLKQSYVTTNLDSHQWRIQLLLYGKAVSENTQNTLLQGALRQKQIDY